MSESELRTILGVLAGLAAVATCDGLVGFWLCARELGRIADELEAISEETAPGHDPDGRSA